MSMGREPEPAKAKVLTVPRVMSINSLTKNKVVNQQGEDLGKIDDIMIDLETGRIAFTVLSAGGRLYAIPWEALKFSFHDKKYILNITRETLVNAPSFAKNNWPDLTSLGWLRQVYAYYGYQPYWNE